MGNEIFRDRLENNVKHALVEAQNCSKLNHPGMVGRVRQIVIDQLLRPLLPEGFYIGTGKVTDARGNLSSETDIIIYDRRSIPPILYDEKEGIFPVEAVHYSIEVKSKLTSAEFKDSVEKGINLRALSGGNLPHSALFAFASDLTASSDAERFIQAQKAMLVPLPINIFCVAGRQYGYWDKVWKTSPPEMANIVVVNFLVGILNTLVLNAQRRRTVLEPGWYFYPEVEMPVVTHPTS